MKPEALKKRSDVFRRLSEVEEQFMCTELLVVINCDYRSESAGLVNTRFTEYGWHVAKREFIHSVTVYVCCQDDTFSVNHRRVIRSH